MKRKTSVNYEGRDLEAMSFAKNYHKWIIDIFRPYIGKSLVEIGAGSGSVTEMLTKFNPDSIAAVEPSIEMYKKLKILRSKNIYTYQNFYTNIAAQISEEHKPDTFFYINVMEHIENDKKEIETVYKYLKRGGSLLIFVPAIPLLHSKFDTKIGHFRRYKKKDLEKLCRDAGFTIKISKYFDFPGIFPWFLKYKILGSTSMSPGLIDYYDNKAVPIIRATEMAVPPLIGKNVILVAKKV